MEYTFADDHFISSFHQKVPYLTCSETWQMRKFCKIIFPWLKKVYILEDIKSSTIQARLVNQDKTKQKAIFSFDMNCRQIR